MNEHIRLIIMIITTHNNQHTNTLANTLSWMRSGSWNSFDGPERWRANLNVFFTLNFDQFHNVHVVWTHALCAIWRNCPCSFYRKSYLCLFLSLLRGESFISCTNFFATLSTIRYIQILWTIIGQNNVIVNATHKRCQALSSSGRQGPLVLPAGHLRSEYDEHNSPKRYTRGRQGTWRDTKQYCYLICIEDDWNGGASTRARRMQHTFRIFLSFY